MDTEKKGEAAKVIKQALEEKDGECAKWMPRRGRCRSMKTIIRTQRVGKMAGILRKELGMRGLVAKEG